jgi:hypothetical protein
VLGLLEFKLDLRMVVAVTRFTPKCSTARDSSKIYFAIETVT